MTAIETISEILNNDNLMNANLKYCLVNESKIPFRFDNEIAKPNKLDDFVNIEDLVDSDLEKYAGLGISIQASNICAIDVDKCFSIPFDINSADERALDIIERFKNVAYIEFSFSGKGLRVFFKQNIIDNYIKKYYIKNDNTNIEYYQPTQSFRYVTITGRYIINNPIVSNKDFINIIIDFLETYMKRQTVIKKKINVIENDDRSIEEIMKKVKIHLLQNYNFQEIWFSQAPGSGQNESQLDFFLLSYLFENIVQDKEKLRLIFEKSPYFKSKDKKHINKWLYNDYRYYNYVYERLGQ